MREITLILPDGGERLLGAEVKIESKSMRARFLGEKDVRLRPK